MEKIDANVDKINARFTVNDIVWYANYPEVEPTLVQLVGHYTRRGHQEEYKLNRQHTRILAYVPIQNGQPNWSDAQSLCYDKNAVAEKDKNTCIKGYNASIQAVIDKVTKRYYKKVQNLKNSMLPMADE